MKKLLLIPLILGFMFVGSGFTIADTTVVVSGDTATAENEPGWLFNRDTSTATPFEFNMDEASIGDGSLYVLPIGANASDKFIAENFLNTAIAEVNSISYDFMIGGGGDVSDENHFYMNVYANFGESDDLKFYDCRYNVVPTVGSTAGFTTVTFDPTQAYPVTTRGGASASPHTCPSVPADMDLASPDSNIRMFALNVGDTSTADVDLDGYLDNVVVDLDSEVTTYDFDPHAVSVEKNNQKTTGGIVASAGSAEISLDVNARGDHPKFGVHGSTFYQNNSSGAWFEGKVSECYAQEENESVFVGEITDSDGYAVGNHFKISVQDNGNGGSGDADRVRVQVGGPGSLNCNVAGPSFPGVRTDGNLKVH